MRLPSGRWLGIVLGALLSLTALPCARAQESGGAPGFEPRNTIGLESEQYLFEEVGRAYPPGQMSFSAARSTVSSDVLYDLYFHPNTHSQGPSQLLGRVTAHYTVAVPNYSRACMAACESAFGVTSTRTSAVVAGRFAGENGAIPVVLLVVTTNPTPGSGLSPLTVVSIMSTTQTLVLASADAITMAQQLEADAAIEWTRANLPAGELESFNPNNQPAPSAVARPVEEHRIRWLYPAGHQPAPVQMSCGQGFNHPNNLWGNPSEALIVQANPEFTVGVVIRCTACEPPRSNLCMTGDPGWSVRLIKGKVARVGNFYFEAAIDGIHPSHEAYAPPGPVGDVWHIDVLWSVEYREAFPLKAPFYDPGALPPTYHWTRLYKCSSTVTCSPN